MHLKTTPAADQKSLQQQIFSRSSKSDARISPMAQFSGLARPAHAVLSLLVVETCRWPALARLPVCLGPFRPLPISSTTPCSATTEQHKPGSRCLLLELDKNFCRER